MVWPTWLNIVAVAGVVILLLATSLWTVYQSEQALQSSTVSTWDSSYDVSLSKQVDSDSPIGQLRTLIWTLFGLLVVTTVSSFFYRLYVFRLRTLARQSDLDRKRLGAYELEEKVGEGGMGVVYRAKHALLRRPTAIKILPPDKSSQAAIDRFEREVQYTSQLKHPNTIAIYDYGRSQNGLFYYAMELLDGLNLEQLVRRDGHLPDGRVVEILRQVCESLREAHAQGLIHRDIKPANIMLCDQGGAVDTVKVLDFGMVRDRTTDSLDFDGSLSGTPNYMAPECFTNPTQIDSRVDVFAVGAVGFFLLTGEPLVNANSLNELIRLHENEISSNVKQRLIEMVRGHVCSGLLSLISKCVATDPDDRPDSVESLLAELSFIQPDHEWNSEQATNWWNSSKNIRGFSSVQTHAARGPEVRDMATTQAFIPQLRRPVARKNKHRLVQC